MNKVERQCLIIKKTRSDSLSLLYYSLYPFGVSQVVGGAHIRLVAPFGCFCSECWIGQWQHSAWTFLCLPVHTEYETWQTIFHVFDMGIESSLSTSFYTECLRTICSLYSTEHEMVP